MQSLERILNAPTGKGGVEPLLNQPHRHAAPDDFGRMMQRALSAKSKDSPRETALRAERKTAAAARNAPRPERDPADSAPTDISSTDSEKPATPTSTEPTSEPAAAALWSLTDLTDPRPQFQLPMPPTGRFISPPTLADLSAASTTNSAVSAIPLNDGATGPAATKPNPTADLVAAEKKESFAAELAPSTHREIAVAQKAESTKIEAAVDADALLKNTAALEIPKPATTAEQKAIELAATASAAHAAENGGTGVATVEVPMKKNANTNKVAGLDGTDLPGEVSRSAREKVLPSPTLAGPVRLADSNSGGANINLTLPETISSVEFSAAQTLAILPSLTDARMRNLERTHDMVALHAVRLVEAQTDTLSVVIKPGAGTELSLELRQRDGSIEAHAVLSRGDFQLMNEHWPELQQRLEQRGIKLAPLGGEANFSTDGGSSFKQQQQSSREMEAQKASAFAEFALAGRTLGATARLAVGGWESWA